MKYKAPLIRLPFLEQSTPPPFYQPQLSDARRRQLDQWFIGHRSQSYYLQAFARFDQAGKLHAQWHWAAFVMTFGWLLYRKRYLDCLVYCVAGWSFIKVNIAIALAVSEFLLIGFVPSEYQLWLRVAIGGGVWLFWASFVARWANAYYYRMARREIADALALHPHDEAAQRAYLRKEGGVSVAGLVGAFAIFASLLMIIRVQFVPMIAMQQERQIAFEAYQQANIIARHIDATKDSRCPVDLPVSSSYYHAKIDIQPSIAGIKSDCVILANIEQAQYPVRYLNGQSLILYRQYDSDGRTLWRCQSTLNRKHAQKGCSE